MVNISPEDGKNKLYSEEFLKKYAVDNEKHLLHVSLRGQKTKDIVVVSNMKGWCICYCLTTKNLLSGWAGDFCV